MSRRIIIIGASDLFEIVSASLPDYMIAGYVDLAEKPDGVRANHTYLGTDEQVLADPGLSDAAFVVGIGDNLRRRKVVERLLQAGRQLPVVVHPQATVFPSARLGPGSIVCPGSVVSTDVRAGLSTMVIYGSLLGHEVRAGDFCFLAPGAKVLNGVTLGDESVIGTNAVVLAGVTIGAGAKLSAGVVANRSVHPQASVILRQEIRNLGH